MESSIFKVCEFSGVFVVFFQLYYCMFTETLYHFIVVAVVVIQVFHWSIPSIFIALLFERLHWANTDMKLLIFIQ